MTVMLLIGFFGKLNLFLKFVELCYMYTFLLFNMIGQKNGEGRGRERSALLLVKLSPCGRGQWLKPRSLVMLTWIFYQICHHPTPMHIFFFLALGHFAYTIPPIRLIFFNYILLLLASKREKRRHLKALLYLLEKLSPPDGNWRFEPWSSDIVMCSTRHVITQPQADFFHLFYFRWMGWQRHTAPLLQHLCGLYSCCGVLCWAGAEVHHARQTVHWPTHTYLCDSLSSPWLTGYWRRRMTRTAFQLVLPSTERQMRENMGKDRSNHILNVNLSQ